jgi:hypothetical protein
MTIKCPKCGYQRSDRDDTTIPDTQCPSCGIFYFKVINQQNNPPPQYPHRSKNATPKPEALKQKDVSKRSIQHANFMIAGCNHENRESLIDRYVRAGDPAILLRDPNNTHSRNAVKILTQSGHHIGYVPETDAQDVAKTLDSGNTYRATFTKIIGHDYPIPVVDVKFFTPANSQPDLPPAKSSLSPYFWVGIFAFIVFGVVRSKKDARDYTATHAAEIAQQEAACKTNLKCLGEKYENALLSPCSRLIERHAKYQFRWDGMRFSRYGWGNTDKTKIIYYGDAVQFQNGFGAWQNMIYSCSYDPGANKITDVAVTPGRLPL